MIIKNYHESNEVNQNQNWAYITDRSYRTLIIGGSGSGRTVLSHFCYALIFIYKQLGSVLSSQSYLYFQGVLASKLLNGCSVF